MEIKMDGNYIFKVETHLHTSQSSACAKNTGAEMVNSYKANGYCAIFVTDHFDKWNPAIPQGNWDNTISAFCKGYGDAKREGDKIGLDVYFGFEFCCDGGNEFLIYNFGKEKLRDYPNIMTDDICNVLTKVRNEGGFIIHAHPFRTAPFIKNPGKIFPEYIDGVEVINTANASNEMNLLALKYAEKYNLLKFSGSDAHTVYPQKGGIAFTAKPESSDDIFTMVLNKDYMILGDEFLK
jgi:predicted metal-dependent phosphoesterase TrpH